MEVPSRFLGGSVGDRGRHCEQRPGPMGRGAKIANGGSSIPVGHHVLVRWLGDQRKLSPGQRRRLEVAARRTEQVALSAASLVEIAILTSQGKLRLKTSLRVFFGEMRSNPAFVVLPLSYDVALDAASLTGLRDPADRVIVATARVDGLTLMTSDQRIIESKLVPTIS